MTDVAHNQPWNDFKDTPEARDAVAKVQQHYIPIVKELRDIIEDKNAEIEGHKLTIQMQRWFLVGIAFVSLYFAVFR